MVPLPPFFPLSLNNAISPHFNNAGAKEAHSVSPHFAQIMYFSIVSALFAAPLHFTIGHALDLFQSFWKNRLLGFLLLFLASIASLLSVHFFR